jgi:hypothetical protein
MMMMMMMMVVRDVWCMGVGGCNEAIKAYRNLF